MERAADDAPIRCLRGGLAALSLGLSLLTLACPARRQGPEVPELEQRNREVDRRILRVETIHEVMRRDLDRIGQLTEDVRNTPSRLFREPFPLALFKHVAVECLNAPASRTAPADAESEAASRVEASTDSFDLSCQPRFVDRLEGRLEARMPGAKPQAFSLLQKLDEFHTLRVRLRTRIAKIRDVVASNRDMLASRRAAVRKLRKKWEERRAELGRAAWRDLKKRFKELREKLRELENKTDALEEAANEWPAAIDDANYKMYFTITSDWERPSEG